MPALPQFLAHSNAYLFAAPLPRPTASLQLDQSGGKVENYGVGLLIAAFALTALVAIAGI